MKGLRKTYAPGAAMPDTPATTPSSDDVLRRACTCHPDDACAGECMEKYAASDCAHEADARERVAAERERDLAERFREAVAAMPYVAERLARGQQFNCYERAFQDEDDDPEDREWIVSIGSISDRDSIVDVTGASLAALFESALKLAALRALPPAPGEGGEG